MHKLRCSGCMREMGLTPTQHDPAVYCSGMCALGSPAAPVAPRNAMITWLVGVRGKRVVDVAREFGLNEATVRDIVRRAGKAPEQSKKRLARLVA